MEDPKVEEARRANIHFGAVDHAAPGFSSTTALRLFESFELSVVIFGEEMLPNSPMHVVYEGAARLAHPFILLDQLYHERELPYWPEADLFLLYAVRPFWKHLPGGRYVTVPPFIGSLTPRSQLGVPPVLQELPW